MFDEIKSTFSEKPAVSAIMIGAGIIVGVVVACFTPLGRIFKKSRR